MPQLQDAGCFICGEFGEKVFSDGRRCCEASTIRGCSPPSSGPSGRLPRRGNVINLNRCICFMRKNGKTNAVGRGGALLRPAGYTELSKIFGESVCTYPLGRRGRCPHRPGRMHRFYGNLRRICNFSMGRQSRRPLQQPFALSVGADDSVRPRDVPILRESSANSQLPPTSKEVTACGFAANSRRNSLHSAGRSRAPPLPTAVAFQRFLRKTKRLWS